MAEKDQPKLMVPFKYESREVPEKRGKISVNLARTDLSGFTFQPAPHGLGETGAGVLLARKDLRSRGPSDPHWRHRRVNL